MEKISLAGINWFWLVAVALLIGLFACRGMGGKKSVAGSSFKNLTADEAYQALQNDSIVALDVRSPQEFQSGHLDKAVLIPVQELAKRIGELGTEKNRPVLVYCRSGNRSRSAARILSENGFTQIMNLDGGTGAWERAGFPLVK